MKSREVNVNFDDYVCRECDQNLKDEKGLHAHMRSHKLRLEDYYARHFPKFDLYDKKPLWFKNREHYFSHDFNTKANLKAWLAATPAEEIRTYMRAWLLNRRVRKATSWAPCQVEFRSLPVPGMIYLTKLFGSYYDVCHELGLKVRFSQTSFTKALKPFDKKASILVDTREKTPLTFTIPSVREGLNFGDYSLNDTKFSQNVFIERKSVGDLYTTIVQGYDRFCREIERAGKSGAYLVVLVEGNFDAVNDYPNTTGGHVHTHPEYVHYRVRTLLQTYEHIQFLFVNNREEASRVVEKIFQSDGQCKTIDLQFAYDTGQL